MARPVLDAEHAEGPGQRVAAVVVDVDVERGEARSLGQEIAAGDAVPDRRVAPLQEGDGRGDGGEVAVELFVEAAQAGRAFFGRDGGHAPTDLAQSVGRKQVKHQRQRDVGLRRRNPARAQEAGQVGGRRVGHVQLRHRRDEREDAGAAGHGGWHDYRPSFWRICGSAASAAFSPSIMASWRAVKSHDLT